MEKKPFFGEGYTLLPLGEGARDGQLTGWRDRDLAVLVAIAAHANKDGRAWPSIERIAILAGCSKTTAISSISNLDWEERLFVERGHRGHRYQIALAEGGDAIAIQQRVVFSGLWATSTPAARKLFILLLALSRPGDGREGRGIPDWKAAVAEAQGPEGVRHVRLQDLTPGHLANSIGAADRTYRDAMACLRRLHLINEEVGPGRGFETLLLPNNPGYFIPDVIAALARCKGKTPAAAATRAATWRRKRREQNLQPLPDQHQSESIHRVGPEPVVAIRRLAQAQPAVDFDHPAVIDLPTGGSCTGTMFLNMGKES